MFETFTPRVPQERAPHTMLFGAQMCNLVHLFHDLHVEHSDNTKVTIDVSHVALYNNVKNPRFTKMYATPNEKFISAFIDLAKGLSGQTLTPADVKNINLKLTRVSDGTWCINMDTSSPERNWGRTSLSFLCGIINESEVNAGILPLMTTH